APPARSRRSSLPSVKLKNPMDRPSGDQNGRIPPAVPASSRASAESIDRTQSEFAPMAFGALEMMPLPSGGNASVVTAEKLVSGGISETQSGASVVLRKSNIATRTAATSASITALNGATFHRLEDGTATVGTEAPPRIHSRASIKSDADCQRLF